jgi:hypothetical protein
MIIYIKSKDEFELWDLLHLNYDDIECNWIDVQLPKEDDEEEQTTSLLKVEIKTDEKDDKWSKTKKYTKIFETLKLAVKLGKVE